MSAAGRTRRNNGPKSQGVNSSLVRQSDSTQLLPVSQANEAGDRPVVPALRSGDFHNSGKVEVALGRLFLRAGASEAAAALLPWVCDALPSANSRRAYHDDLKMFVDHMAGIGVRPFAEACRTE